MYYFISNGRTELVNDVGLFENQDTTDSHTRMGEWTVEERK